MFTVEYIKQRMAELRRAMDTATYLERDDMFHFYRGQLHTWDGLLREMSKVA